MPQNVTPSPCIHPLCLSLFLSRAASPLIQRNSRRLSTPLYHCFTWEETRIRGIKEGVYREIRNVLFLVHPSLFLSIVPLYHISSPLVEFANRGIRRYRISSRCIWQNFFFFRRAELVEVLFVRSRCRKSARFDYSRFSYKKRETALF